MVVICAGCDRPILDRFLLNVLDRAWHAGCVQCCDCKNNLTERCFSRDGKLYCRQDFFRRFGTKCGGCAQDISPNELVRRARSRVYHLKCFTCLVCRKQLSTGEELYMLDENRFLCKADYLAKFQNGDPEENDLDVDPTTFENTEDTFSDKDASTHDDDDDDDDASRDSIAGHHHHHHHHNNNLVNNNNSSNNNNNNNNGSSAGHVGLASNPNPALSSHFPGSTHPGALDPALEAAGGVGGPVGGPLQGVIKQEKMNNTDSNCSVDSVCSQENGGPGTGGGGGGGGGGASGCGGGGGGAKDAKGDAENNNSKDAVDNPSAGKRRGPRTTIKAKQLETLKAAFAATPKPTRHIREQLAQETGLNMRVIQVWFQNRRSKERRMKQLSALGVRRQFFRNPRRLRALRPGEELADELGQPGFNYFVENADFYPGYPGYADYFGGHHPDPEAMAYLPPTSGHQGASHLLDQVSGQPMHDGPFLPGDLGMRPNGSPEPPPPMGAVHHDGHFGGHGLPHHVMAGLHGPFGRYPGLRHQPPPPPPHPDMPAEIW